MIKENARGKMKSTPLRVQNKLVNQNQYMIFDKIFALYNVAMSHVWLKNKFNNLNTNQKDF